MLTITHEAAAVLANERASSGAPESFGVRLFAATPPEGGDPQLALSFVPEATPGDQVTEQEGITAFVAPEVSAALDDATLDASATDGVQQLVLRS